MVIGQQYFVPKGTKMRGQILLGYQIPSITFWTDPKEIKIKKFWDHCKKWHYFSVIPDDFRLLRRRSKETIERDAKTKEKPGTAAETVSSGRDEQ
jgi:hypothetical protein